MERLFPDAPEALAEPAQLLARIHFSLADLRYEYLDEIVPPGWTPDDWLGGRLAQARRYSKGVPAQVAQQIETVLRLIARLGYAHYFPTILDIVRVAESKGTLCQCRGSAANRLSPTSWAAPAWTGLKASSCSLASSPNGAASRPTSMWTSSRGARRVDPAHLGALWPPPRGHHCHAPPTSTACPRSRAPRCPCPKPTKSCVLSTPEARTGSRVTCSFA